MKTCFMIRHGECIYNRHGNLNGMTNSRLTEKGEQQAKDCAQKLKELTGAHIDVVYSSPLRRAFGTARIIVNELGLSTEIIPDDRLIERDFGVLTGRPVSEISKYANDIIIGDRVEYFLDTLGAESYDQVYERAQSLLRDMINRHSNDNVLLVTHGAIGQIIWAAYYNYDWRIVLAKRPYFDNSEIIELNGKIPKL